MVVVVVLVVVVVVCPFWKEILVPTEFRSIWQDFAPSDFRQLITVKSFYRSFMTLYSALAYRTTTSSQSPSITAVTLPAAHNFHNRQLLFYILQSGYHTSCIFSESVSLCIISNDVKDPPSPSTSSRVSHFAVARCMKLRSSKKALRPQLVQYNVLKYGQLVTSFNSTVHARWTDTRAFCVA